MQSWLKESAPSLNVKILHINGKKHLIAALANKGFSVCMLNVKDHDIKFEKV